MQPTADSLERCGVHHVIVMLVREQHVVHAHTALADPVGDAFRGVDEQVAVGSFDKIAVGLDKAAGVEGDFHDAEELAEESGERAGGAGVAGASGNPIS